MTELINNTHYTTQSYTLLLSKSKAVPLRHASVKRERKYTYSFLTSASGVSGQSHAPVTLYLGERTPVTYWLGGWFDLRAGLDTEA
jgi:hypothetical protein